MLMLGMVACDFNPIIWEVISKGLILYIETLPPKEKRSSSCLFANTGCNFNGSLIDSRIFNSLERVETKKKVYIYFDTIVMRKSFDIIRYSILIFIGITNK